VPFVDGRVYQTPDGRRFRATREARRYDSDQGWIFFPPEVTHERLPLRDELMSALFLEKGRIVYFDFSGNSPRVVDTGWNAGDLALERDAPAA
jgi:hypothetical protein